MLEASFRQIWVEGEITNLAQPASGHIYFSLKEENTTIRCAFFRQRRNSSSCKPAEGMQVLLSGQISLYQNRGDMQLIVSHMAESGAGKLLRQFEQLKAKLESEGLFDADHKQSIPRLPDCVALITSAHGAALHDVRVTLQRRFPAVKLLLYPSNVQGDGAVEGIVQMLQLANQQRLVDVILVARGGGALEDLQAFNDEAVARAIYASALPVISGVGHESDITIADLVADFRAATPTAAAESVCMHRDELMLKYDAIEQRLTSNITTIIRDAQQRLDYLTAELTNPLQQLTKRRHELHQVWQRLNSTTAKILSTKQLRLIKLTTALEQLSPLLILSKQQQVLYALTSKLVTGLNTYCNHQNQHLTTLEAKLSVLSPYRTLQRGYSILQHGDAVIQNANTVKQGQILDATLAEGRLKLTVTK